MTKAIGTFINEMPLSIQERAKRTLVYCQNGTVRSIRKKSKVNKTKRIINTSTEKIGCGFCDK